MTIDLGLASITLYIDGILPANTGIRVNLTSNYSQTKIWVDKAVSSHVIHEEWYSLVSIPNTPVTYDIEGFYTLKVEAYVNSVWTVVGEYLVKCLNSSNTTDNITEYLSDNEDNEQTIFYE